MEYFVVSGSDAPKLLEGAEEVAIAPSVRIRRPIVATGTVAARRDLGCALPLSNEVDRFVQVASLG